MLKKNVYLGQQPAQEVEICHLFIFGLFVFFPRLPTVAYDVPFCENISSPLISNSATTGVISREKTQSLLGSWL